MEGVKHERSILDDLAERFGGQNQTVLRTSGGAYIQKMTAYQGALELHAVFKGYRLQRLALVSVPCAATVPEDHNWVRTSDMFALADLRCKLESFVYLFQKDRDDLRDTVVDMLHAIGVECLWTWTDAGSRFVSCVPCVLSCCDEKPLGLSCNNDWWWSYEAFQVGRWCTGRHFRQTDGV